MKNKLLAVMLGAVLVLGACGGNKAVEKEPDTTTGTPVAVDADKVVQRSCVSCHGNNLAGQGNAPALADVGARLSEEEIHDVIVKGRPGMPAGVIKGDEATAVAKWLSEKK